MKFSKHKIAAEWRNEVVLWQVWILSEIIGVNHPDASQASHTWQFNHFLSAAQIVGSFAEIFPEVLLLDLTDDKRVPAADVVVVDPVHVGDLLPLLLPDDGGGGVGVHVTDQLHLVLPGVAVDEHLGDLDLRAVLHHHLHQLWGLLAVSVAGGALVSARVLPVDVAEDDLLAGDVSRAVRHHSADPGPADSGGRLTSCSTVECHVISGLHFQQRGSAHIHWRWGWNTK